jgi:HlyD family type I secretion membrane fusion protein
MPPAIAFDHHSTDRLRLGGVTFAGFLVSGAFFLAFGGWAATVPLSSAIVTTGVVEVENQRKLVQHFEGGIVAELAAREGQRVAAGELLIALDTTQPRARLDLLEGRLANRLALAARLRAERDEQPVVTFPHDDPAMATQPGRDAVEVQTALFDVRRRALAGGTAILQKRIEQTGEEIVGLEQLVAAHDRLIGTLQDEAGDLEGLFDQGLTTRERYMALRRREAEMEGERAVHIAAIARARKSISELEQQIAELGVTRLNEAVEELSKVEADLVDLQQQVLAATDVLRRAAIRAPLAGTIMNLKVHSTWGVVSPGEPLMEIVPIDPKLVLKAQIRPEDVDEVMVGQEVEVRLRSRDGLDHPAFIGSVRGVSGDRFVDERTGQGYFTALIDVDVHRPTTSSSFEILPGMNADVSIVVGSRTFFQYLTGPLQRRLSMSMREH